MCRYAEEFNGFEFKVFKVLKVNKEKSASRFPRKGHQQAPTERRVGLGSLLQKRLHPVGAALCCEGVPLDYMPDTALSTYHFISSSEQCCEVYS